MDDIRDVIVHQGLSNFSAAKLAEADLNSMAWAGDALHIEIVREQLNDKSTDAETLAIYTSNGVPVAKGYVVYDLATGEATISQLATHPNLQSLGLGTMLLCALENTARELGIRKAVLGVESTNPRARKLYEKLGYEFFKSDVDSWEAADANGDTYTHHTDVDWLSKLL